MTRRFVILLLVVAATAMVIGGIGFAYDTWHDGIERKAYTAGDAAGAGRVQALWDNDRARALAATVEDARQKAAETLRRLTKQRENDDAQATRLAQVSRDRDHARAMAGGLQLTASAYLDAAGCGGRVGDSATACVRAAVDNALNVFGRCSNRVAELAGAVDDARARGQLCEANYDALVLKPSLPRTE